MSLQQLRSHVMPIEAFSFCEPVWASTLSSIHIRILDGERQLGGGIAGFTLCGRDITGGWDLAADVDEFHVDGGNLTSTNPLCLECIEVWRVMADLSGSNSAPPDVDLYRRRKTPHVGQRVDPESPVPPGQP